MTNKQKRYTAKEIMRVLRLHLTDNLPVAEICNDFGLNRNVFYHWKEQFFENRAAALLVLERLRETCELKPETHLDKQRHQIVGLDPSSLKKICDRFAEDRLLTDTSHTNRRNNRSVRLPLQTLADSDFQSLSESARKELMDTLQDVLVGSLEGYYTLERIHFDFDPAKPSRAIIAEILTHAQHREQSGPVALHLVGAKLAVRFPHLTISNLSFGAAANQAGRQGDFHIRDTAFHVTVAPAKTHIARCAENIRQGVAPWLLVNDSNLEKVRHVLEYENLHERVTAESVESFVGQNLSELAEFSLSNFTHRLSDLLAEYNRRVAEVETNQSLLLDIPAALKSQQE